MRSGIPGEESPLEDLHALAYRKCIPLHVSLELTLECNIRCAHCYNFDRDEPRTARAPELTMEERRALLDDLRRSGTLFLSLTGGEAMVHPRFWDILDETAARRFGVTLLSNGTLLTEQACDRLASYPNLWDASLSVYGALPGTHDAITRSRGSLRRTLDGARRLSDRGIRTGLKFVLMKTNAGEAAAMIEQAERLGLTYTVDSTITGRYDGTVGSLDTRIDHAVLETLYRGPLRHLLTKNPAEPTDDQFKCNCARENAAVSSTGEVWPCIATPLRAGSVREQPFSTIWKDSALFSRIRNLGLADFKTCAPCPLKAWCTHNPSSPVLLHGDFTGVDPWTCREAEILRDIQG